eukprot:m.95755 g.95755  ORF g.95755 m.95755 type:complete len:50 (+) comp16615_c0_seq3:115-264(+)
MVLANENIAAVLVRRKSLGESRFVQALHHHVLAENGSHACTVPPHEFGE